MVNYHDPVVLAQDYSVVAKIWHAVAGLYFWEFVTTLDFEWSVIRRHRPYRWSIWIYSTTRIASVIDLIIVLYGLNVSTPYNCEVETILKFFFGYLAIAAASLLIVLRILAIWNNKKIIVAIATGVLLINIIFLIQGIVRIRAEWVPVVSSCMLVNLHITELNILVTLATDITLLLIMSLGLLRLGFHERSAIGLGRFLWKQGLIWLLVATIAEVLPAVFICLNLNEPLNGMFLPPSMVTLSIAATRIHRSLIDYTSVGRCGQLSNPKSLQGRGHIEWKDNTAAIKLALPSHMNVVINRTHEQDQTFQTSYIGSLTGVEEQSPTRQPRFDENADNGVRSPT